MARGKKSPHCPNILQSSRGFGSFFTKPKAEPQFTSLDLYLVADNGAIMFQDRVKFLIKGDRPSMPDDAPRLLVNDVHLSNAGLIRYENTFGNTEDVRIVVQMGALRLVDMLSTEHDSLGFINAMDRGCALGDSFIIPQGQLELTLYAKPVPVVHI